MAADKRDGLLNNGSLEVSILAKRLLPAAVELITGDDPDFDIDVETNIFDNQE